MSGAQVLHTDDLIGTHGWSEASAAAALWFDQPGPLIVEGVAVSRALRKWRAAHPGEPPPVDRLYFLAQPLERLTSRQSGMGTGCSSVHLELVAWLGERAVEVEHPDEVRRLL